jgi:hypothetical protein
VVPTLVPPLTDGGAVSWIEHETGGGMEIHAESLFEAPLPSHTVTVPQTVVPWSEDCTA